jgi:hypothetical protein
VRTCFLAFPPRPASFRDATSPSCNLVLRKRCQFGDRYSPYAGQLLKYFFPRSRAQRRLEGLDGRQPLKRPPCDGYNFKGFAAVPADLVGNASTRAPPLGRRRAYAQVRRPQCHRPHPANTQSDTSGRGGFHVAERVANHRRTCEIEVEIGGGLQDHPGLRIAPWMIDPICADAEFRTIGAVVTLVIGACSDSKRAHIQTRNGNHACGGSEFPISRPDQLT